jgi:LAS superfamily LD-carboxypeptidase LdcB
MICSLLLVLAFSINSDQKCWETQSVDYSIHYDKRTVGYSGGEKIEFLSTTIPYKNKEGGWHRLETKAAKHFLRLANRLRKKGFNIMINSSFRSKTEQKRLRKKVGEFAAKPGWSNHQSGLAVDIAGTTAFVPFDKIEAKHFSQRYCIAELNGKEFGYRCPTRLFWYLKKVGPHYGFYNTVENEPWHWEYIAVKQGQKLVKMEATK